METFSSMFFTYTDVLTSWWWIALSVSTFTFILITSMMDNNEKFTRPKALQLAFVGIAIAIPFFRTRISEKLMREFRTQVTEEETHLYQVFFLLTGIASYFATPILILLLAIASGFDRFMSTHWAYDLSKYGLKKTIQLNFFYKR